MKHRLRALLAVALLALTPAACGLTEAAFAEQGVKATGGTIASGTANAAYTIRFDNGESVCGVSLTGLTTSGATLTIEGSFDQGATWTATPATPLATAGSTFTTVAADGQFRVDVAAFTNLRFRVSSTGSGAIGIAYSAIPGTGL